MDAANLRGRAGNRRSQRRQRRVRVLCPAFHAHVACLRCMRRRANRLICSQVGMSERRAGQRTKGHARCRGHREDSLPHRLAPFRKGHLHSSLYPIGRRKTPRSSVFRGIARANAHAAPLASSRRIASVLAVSSTVIARRTAGFAWQEQSAGARRELRFARPEPVVAVDAFDLDGAGAVRSRLCRSALCAPGPEGTGVREYERCCPEGVRHAKS
jgi:hypothetical protein